MVIKKRIYLVIICVLLTLTAFNSNAASFTNDKKDFKEAAANMTAEQKEARIEEIKLRVQQIRDMDLSQLDKAQKKELKAELKSLKHEARAIDSGAYLSIGAIFVIILVLIVIL
jgi:ABC-type enterochelin transport system substrate-binding protein